MRKAWFAIMIAIAIAVVACTDTGSDPQQNASGRQQAQQQSTPDQDNQSEADQAQPEQSGSAAQTSQPRQDQQQQTATSSSDSKQTTSSGDSANSANSDESESSQAQPQSASPAQAEQPEEEVVPEGTRIISLFGDITEILYALGVEEHIVGVDASSVYPEVARELPDVGFAGALNAEGVLALNPSIVIGGSIVPPGPVGVVEQLEQAGVSVLVLPQLIDLSGPATKIRIIGEAIGIPRRAEALARQVEAEIEEAKPRLDEDDEREPLSVLFVYLRRGGIQLVSGAGREAETIITAAGGIDAGAAAGLEGWQPLSPEALLAINPDVYLVMELGFNAVGELDGLLAIPGMAETKAGRHERVIVMEDILLLGFGPRMAESIVQLRDFLADVQASLEDTSGSDK